MSLNKCGMMVNYCKGRNLNGEYYGISADSLREDVACIQIVDSIADVKKRAQQLGAGNMKIVSFYIHVPPEERTKRMLARGDSLDSIQKRLEIDNLKFKNAKEAVDYVIENDILERAVDEIINLAGVPKHL